MSGVFGSHRRGILLAHGLSPGPLGQLRAGKVKVLRLGRGVFVLVHPPNGPAKTARPAAIARPSPPQRPWPGALSGAACPAGARLGGGSPRGAGRHVFFYNALVLRPLSQPSCWTALTRMVV